MKQISRIYLLTRFFFLKRLKTEKVFITLLLHHFLSYNGCGHLYDDSSAPSLHGKNSEIGAKEVNIKVSKPFISLLHIK